MIRLIWGLFFVLISYSLYGQDYWAQVTTTGEIPARENLGMVYDESGNRLIVFGGNGENGFLNDIWQLDLFTYEWMEIPVVSIEHPEPRHTPEAFLGPDNNLWIITGQSTSGLHNDVWKFDFQDSTWTELFTTIIAPGISKPRYGTASMFDPETNNFILFAGFATNGRIKDTQTFSIDSLVWTNRGLPIRPERRCLHNGVFAEDRREFWIFGGQFEGNRNDTWRMAVDSFIWQEFIPPVAPPTRHFHSMVYRGNDEMVVFGGNAFAQGNYSGALNDIWKFDGGLVEWDTLPQGGIIPESRIGHSAVYIPVTDEMIVFGGRNPGGFLDDLWIYDFNPVNVSAEEVIETERQRVKLFPNPAAKSFTLSFNDPLLSFSLKIFDIKGQLVLYDKSGSPSVDISSLNQGVYFVRVFSESKEFVLKLAVE